MPSRNQSEPNRCTCGCGREIGPRSEFAPGHDAKHKRNLMQRFRDGDAFAASELVLRRWIEPPEYAKLDNERRAALPEAH